MLSVCNSVMDIYFSQTSFTIFAFLVRLERFTIKASLLIQTIRIPSTLNFRFESNIELVRNPFILEPNLPFHP